MGPPIKRGQALLDWLRFEDALYIDGEWYPCSEATEWDKQYLLGCDPPHSFRQALWRVGA